MRKNESRNTKCYAVESCEVWEIVYEITTRLSDCQIFRDISYAFSQILMNKVNAGRDWVVAFIT